MFTPSKAVEAVHRSGRRWRFALGLALAVLALVVVLAILWGRTRSSLTVPLPDDIRLGVARFTSAEPSPNAQRIAVGMGECLAADLVLLEEQQYGAMWVLPRASPTTLSEPGLAEAVRNDGLTVVLEGRISTADATQRVELSLVDPKTHDVVRRAEVSESTANPAACRRQAVAEVATMLGIDLDGDTLERLRRTGTVVAAARDAYLRGLGAMAADRPELDFAVSELERATSVDPGFAAAWSALASALAERAAGASGPDIDGALAAARKAVAVGWDPRGTHLTLASVLSDAGKPTEALEALESAVRERPRSAEAHLRLGKALLKAGRFDEAEAALQHSVYLRPTYWITHHWLGRLDWERDHIEAAAVHWERVLELVPENPKAHTNLGAAYDSLDRPDDARRMYERSLELQPKDNVKARSNLGKAYYDLGRFQDASRTFAQVVAETPMVSRYWGNLGAARLWSGDRERAEAAFRRAIELAEPELKTDPDDLEETARVAQYNAYVGQRDVAVTLLRRAESLEPTNATACAVLAEGWEPAGDRARALYWVSEALSKGISPRRFNTDPAMRELVADPRYRVLVHRPTTVPVN